LHAGGQYVVDPSRLLQDMRPSTLGLWLGMAEIDPFDGNRADLNAATVASSLMAANGVTTKDGRPFSPADFLPFARVQEPAEAIEQRQVQSLRAFLDARVKKKA
jgi:hypothetical protein